MARKTLTEKACEAYNKARGLQYPNPGYLYFADIKGTGKRSVWACNATGGVTRSSHNKRRALETIISIRAIT